MNFVHKAFGEHDPAFWPVVIWALTIPLYIGLQAWFGIAWKGRWRIVALIPLIGVALAAIVLGIVAVTIPDAPPIDLNAILAVPLAAIFVVAPLGLAYEVIVGIVWLTRRRPATA
jgi:hypothetical protein